MNHWSEDKRKNYIERRLEATCKAHYRKPVCLKIYYRGVLAIGLSMVHLVQ